MGFLTRLFPHEGSCCRYSSWMCEVALQPLQWRNSSRTLRFQGWKLILENLYRRWFVQDNSIKSSMSWVNMLGKLDWKSAGLMPREVEQLWSPAELSNLHVGWIRLPSTLRSSDFKIRHAVGRNIVFTPTLECTDCRLRCPHSAYNSPQNSEIKRNKYKARRKSQSAEIQRKRQAVKLSRYSEHIDQPRDYCR